MILYTFKRVIHAQTMSEGGEMLFSHGTKKECGVIIAIKKGFNCEIMNIIEGDFGRSLVVQLKIGQELFVLVNIYALNRDKPYFF